MNRVRHAGPNKSNWTKCLQRVTTTLVCCALGLSTAQASIDIAIAKSPLFLTSSVDPNILFILDDSGSMHWEIMPDEHIVGTAYLYERIDYLYGPRGYVNRAPTFEENAYNAFTRSKVGNALYYDPSITYRPWPKSDGSLMPNADPKNALHNPMREDLGGRDLTTNNSRYGQWVYCNSITRNADGSFRFSDCSIGSSSQTFWPAVYFWHDGSNSFAYSNYERVEIRPEIPTYKGHGRENRTDCKDAANATCTYEEEIQNFANWYTYYRSRILAARGGIGAAFAAQGENMRVGFGTINAEERDVDGVTTRTIIRGVRPFKGDDRDAFFDLLYDRNIPTKGTPLRRALQAAGEYFSRDDNRGPWSDTPGIDSNEKPTDHLTCRKSYTILMTDGYWNGDDPSGIGNQDGTSGPVITAPDGRTFQYTPTNPYQDRHSNTLADVAMYYWKHDLRPDLANEVPVNSKNEAFWQHMVTFGVGLGVTGSIDPKDAWQAVQNSSPIAWPNPTSSNAAKIDDLLHASINSRGGFFSATNPEEFARELTNVLASIVARTESSATAAAVSSAVLQGDTLLFSAGFRSTDWSGMFKAYKLDANGKLDGVAWDAEEKLANRDPNTRKIFTTNSDTGRGTTLQFGNLGSAQKHALNHADDNSQDNLGAERVAWLRGDDNAHNSFRKRLSPEGKLRLLGDVINGNPQFMGRRNAGYAYLEGHEGSSYINFLNSDTVKNRPDVMFVAANDGMLHAFNAEDGPEGGNELFAYMPSELLRAEHGRNHAPLSRLMSQDYDHRYFLDGTPTIGDAYFNNQWQTVLVGTMGVGGRTVFALDVTDPENFSANNVLWEFTDPDLGYGVSQPLITRMNNGDWVAIFGNGYNSDNHRAVLFIVRLADGKLLAKIDTGEGNAANPNGMAAPIATDWPTMNLTTNYVYAGDLQGNLWRFDLTDTNPNQWKNANNRNILFTAQDANGKRQPITARPSLAVNPDDNDFVVVLFGTGSYFRSQDSSDSQTQTLYGIHDRPTTDWRVEGRDQLLEQTIDWQEEVRVNGNDWTVRETSDKPIDLSRHRGWYMDLIYRGKNHGERVIAEATFPSSGGKPDRVRFTTLVPDDDPCGSGREGFVMDLMIVSGARYHESVFDLSSDGVIDEDDMVYGRIISGVQFGTGERLTSLRGDGNIEYLYPGDPESAGGEPLIGLGSDVPIGRQSWRQIR